VISFLTRNDEKWPYTRQIKIAGRNHILPPFLFDEYVAILHRYDLKEYHCKAK
jgi:hypothetical protein